MKLQEALQVLNEANLRATKSFEIFLACGFTPLHLRTFLIAHVARRCTDRPVQCRVGLYGDVLAALSHPDASAAHAVAAVIEWPDIDPRLGYRRLGGWTGETLEDVSKGAIRRLAAIRHAIGALARTTRVAVSPPSLPLPAAFQPPRWQSGRTEWLLRKAVTDFAADCATIPEVTVLGPQHVDRATRLTDRHDVRSELAADFPYRLDHASGLAEGLALLLRPPVPLKGVITDLDDTLWRGLVGEVGPDGVSWDLDRASQVHGLYQQVLRSLVEAGVLVAIASKNDPANVQAALSRPDIVMSADHFFPVEVGWGLKSAAVERILRVWNIAADSVVFIDDSPMELAEVRASFPMIRCECFPSRDAAAALDLIGRLRDWFGKEAVTAEDRLRLDSLRRAAPFRAARDSGDGRHSLDEFLAQAEAEITVDFGKESDDPRAIELINKTNQFNLNGVRVDETSWRHTLAKSDAFLAIVSYTDKFGALGKISVVCGCRSGRTLVVDHWVLSCRAFSRRIEHRTLDVLFKKFDVDSILLRFAETDRNGPLREFLAGLLDQLDGGKTEMTRAAFRLRCPPLFHRVHVHE